MGPEHSQQMASSPGCRIPERGQRWAAGAARAAARPSTDQGHWERVTESVQPAASPAFTAQCPGLQQGCLLPLTTAWLPAPALGLSGETPMVPHSPRWGAACALAGT